MNRTDRLVAMVMFLQGRRLVRAEDMAAHFEVSVRTIYRDLSALSESGVPLSGEPGVGYSLMKSYHLPPVMLTGDEASALFVGAELARRLTDRSLRLPLEAALLKLRAVLPRERQEYVQQMTDKTVVMAPRSKPTASPGDREWLLPLQEAAVRRNVVELSYRGRGREQDTVRTVEPLGVVFYGDAWYLVAWCRLRSSMRHFRLDRMQHVEVRSERFEPRPEFSLARHLETKSCDGEMLSVRLWFSARGLERARRESYAAFFDERAAGGGFEISMATYSLVWLSHWILSFGAEAEALAPEELRQNVCDLARQTLQRYGQPAEPEPQWV